jgi:hypothetical protein
MKIRDIKVKFGGHQVMTAAEGDLGGTSELTVDHPAWTLSENEARGWASGMVKAPALEVTGKMQITVTIGKAANMQVPAGNQAAAREKDWKKNMKLKSFAGKTAKCVFKPA